MAQKRALLTLNRKIERKINKPKSKRIKTHAEIYKHEHLTKSKLNRFSITNLNILYHFSQRT